MAIWSSRSNKKNKQAKNPSRPKVLTTNPYHCVELKMSHNACDAVLELQGKRYLSLEAPQVPLASCDRDCACVFKHHEDRRAEDRRDAFSPGGIHYDGVKNRRLGTDRRRASKTQTHIHIG